MTYEGITKACTRCKKELPLALFSNSKHGRLGKMSRCKACDKAKVMEWRKRNADKHRSEG